MALKLIELLCCLNNQTAFCLEGTLMVVILFGLIMKILGVVFIPWERTSSIMHLLFIICMIILIGLELMSVTVGCIFGSIKKKISTNKKYSLFIVGILGLSFSFLCSLFEIMVLFVTSSDLKEFNKDLYKYEYDESNNVTNVEYLEDKYVTNGELVLSVIILIIITIVFIVLFFLWISETVRIKLGIRGSYTNYLKHVCKNNCQSDNNITEKEFYPYTKGKEKGNEKGISIVGHDKRGNPIFGKQVDGKIIIQNDLNLNNSDSSCCKGKNSCKKPFFVNIDNSYSEKESSDNENNINNIKSCINDRKSEKGNPIYITKLDKIDKKKLEEFYSHKDVPINKCKEKDIYLGINNEKKKSYKNSDGLINAQFDKSQSFENGFVFNSSNNSINPGY